MNTRKRWVLLVAATLAVVFPLTGCATWFQPPTATSHPTGESVTAELKPFYDQVLTWASCGNGMQCADATAPLDWADLKGPTIKLALVRQPATSGHPIGSLLVNPGGPGASGYDFIHDNVDYATSKRLQASYDIVGFDPRGVEHSTPVKCYSNPADLDSYIFDILPGTRGSDAWISEADAASAKFGADCLKYTGALLGHVDTVSAARDLDLLRATLGDKKLNYLGYSYGTELGGTYAEMFPAKTGRIVFDGAVDPTASNFDVSLAQAKGFESALRAFLAACPTFKGCPFRGTVDQSMTEIRALLDRLDVSPLRNSDGRELGANTMFTAIILPLYNESNWPSLAQVFATEMTGDPADSFTVADAYYDRTAQGKYTTNSTEAFQAVTCLDYPTNESTATMRTEAAELDAQAPVFGHLMAWGGTSCFGWPFPPTGTPHSVVAQGSSDILVVGTTNDPATPYAWAQKVASQLAHGHLVTYTGQGHTAYNKSNACVNNTVDNYFIDGTVPKTDPQC